MLTQHSKVLSKSPIQTPLSHQRQEQQRVPSPQDPHNWRMWDLVTQLVYKRGRTSYNHKSVTLYMARTETTPIFTPWRLPIFHHKEAEQAQPKLNRATSPNHRAARESCCQWDTEQEPGVLFWDISLVVVSLLTSIFTEAAKKETNQYMAH